MKGKVYCFFSVILVLVSAGALLADDPTSKFLPLPSLSTTLPASSAAEAVQVEVWDMAAGGALIFSEAHSVDTDAASNITNDNGFGDFLLGRPD